MKSSKLSIYLVVIITSVSFSARALVGIDELTKSLYQKNNEISAAEKNNESKVTLSSSSSSAYYPTLNVVGGYGHNKTDDQLTPQKGYLGYIEGRLNIFRGFKDQSMNQQKEIQQQISKLDLESKKREVYQQFIDVMSTLIYLHKIQDLLNEEYKLTQIQKQMAAKKVAAGLTGAVDNLEFDLRENEIQIEQKQIYQQHQEIHQKLVKLYGEDINDKALEKIDFSHTESLTQVTAQFNIEETVNYKKVKLIHEKAEYEKSEIKADFLPTLDFTYSVGRLTPSDIVPIHLNESKYAIQLTIPVFSGFETYYKTKSASLLVQASENLKLQMANDLRAEFSILKTKISELAVFFSLNEKKLVSVQKYFDLTLAEYKRGIKNSPDLVSATERLFSAKKKKYEILKELEILKVKIERY